VPETYEIRPIAPPLTVPPTTTPLIAPTAPAPAPATVAPSPAPPPKQVVARLADHVVYVYEHAGDARPVAALTSTTEFKNSRVLPVQQQGGDWLRVQLPTRPNGAVGWIRSKDATLDSVTDRVVVDRAERTLTWTRGGTVQLQATVAIGAPSSPTPTGDFFVTDVLPENPNGEYGAWVIALNAHSDAFTEFQGGDARIAIHGTNDPASIGRAASAGCVRTEPGVLATLATSLPAGTPVEIR
jgi:lipoprotein-anchoring transpeptidase ErfK/SrfK